MKSTSKASALAALAAAIVGGSVFGAFAVAGSGNNTGPVARHFDRFSAPGTPVVNLSTHDAETLTSGGGKPELSRITTRGGTAFYTAPASSSGLCFARGSVATGHLSVLACPRPGVGTSPMDFPSDPAPVLDMSASIGSIRAGEGRRLLDLTGFAADGVARVGMIDINGELHDTLVDDNVYYAKMPDVTVKAIVAFDSMGREVYHQDDYRG